MVKISDFMTVGEASAYLCVSKDSLRRWDRAGKLTARRHPANGYRLYLKAELDKFLSQFGLGDAPSRGTGSAGKKQRTRKKSR